jgi:Domain of unknown function (DUF5666)
MKPILIALSFAALSVVLWPTPYALAENTKVARGTVTALSGSSLTVKVRDQQMKFDIDLKTTVEAPGAGTKTRQANASGKPGPKLADVVKIGQAVAVTYNDMPGSMHATHVRTVSSAYSGSGSAAKGPSAAMTASGIVQSVGSDSITIGGNAGAGAAFRQTFMIDETTRVFAKGAGTKAASAGGKAPFAELVASGDRVSVEYHKKGTALHASDIRVTWKSARTSSR